MKSLIADEVIIEEFLKKILPDEPGADTVYLDLDKVRDMRSASGTSKCTETNDEERPFKTRYEWPVEVTKKLLCTIKESKSKFENATNKNSVWLDIAKQMGTVNVTGQQCRERYYTLKKAYRKFVADSKKTGNKRPKPFIYEELMADIVLDDPTFTPVVAKGTLDPPNDQPESDTDGSREVGPSVSEPERKKKSQMDELKEYMAERDERFLKALNDMNAKQNALMEELIEKL